MDDVKSAISDCNDQEKVESSPALEEALFMIPAEHTPLNCRDWEEVITEFLDGFVPATTYHRFEEHAAACGSCSDLLTDVVYAVAACHSVHTYEEYDVTDALADRLLKVMPESADIQRLRNILLKIRPIPELQSNAAIEDNDTTEAWALDPEVAPEPR